MKTMIREIYLQRYGKILLFVMGFFIVLSIWSGMNNVSHWQANYDYFHSEEFNSDYNLNPEDYVKEYDLDQPIFYDSIEEYRHSSLQVFNRYDSRYLPTFAEQGEFDYSINKNEDFQLGVTYHSLWGWGHIYNFTTIAMFILGFLLFFVDQKSGFNQFLFSLSVKRRSLFTGKLVYIVLPLVGSMTLGGIAKILIRWFGIPQPYLNATLPQMFYSGFSYLMLAVTFLVIGIFFGTLLGHLVLTPIVLMIGLYLSAVGIYYFYGGVNTAVTYFFPDVRFWQLEGLLVGGIGKTGSPLWVIPGLLLFNLLILWAAERNYRKISLEYDGEFLLNPRSKRVMFLSLFIGWNLFFTVGNFVTPIFFTEMTPTIRNWVNLLVQIIIVFVVSFGLVYFKDIHKRWLSRRRVFS